MSRHHYLIGRKASQEKKRRRKDSSVLIICRIFFSLSQKERKTSVGSPSISAFIFPTRSQSKEASCCLPSN